jgi:Fe-S-cluster formation regulator IscX/YfhJ
MKEKFDPFFVFMTIIFVSILSTICYMSKLERDDKNKRAELVKEAIEKNWTPEQIRVILESR